MADPGTPRLLLMRLVFVGLALAILFFHLLPLDTRAPSWAPPDLLVAFAMAWTLRRPDYLPAPVLTAVMLLADLMLQRPPGLLALLVVIGCEYLRQRAVSGREASFVEEWLAVGLTLAAITAANRLILALVAVPQAQPGLTVIQLLLTIAVYPLVVAATQSLFGVRRPAPGDAAALGARG